MTRSLNIVFMGTPEFALPSLEILLKNKYKLSAVVTAPDKPAGRGRQIRMSDVKQFAIKHKIQVLQPQNLKDEGFLKKLRNTKANLFIVVAFRMLPKIVWEMPEFGTFNLHASLLPDYRGAAPLNRVIMNGEEETGLTTFFLNDKIDTGDILYRVKTSIKPGDTVGDLHDRLMYIGADLVIETVNAIENDKINVTSQDYLIDKGSAIKLAPKIYKEDCQINWNKGSKEIYNLIRGLSPVPGAFTFLVFPNNKKYLVKILRSTYDIVEHEYSPGFVNTDGKTYLKISTIDGWISIQQIQLSGKKRMPILDFLKGFKM